VGHGPTSKLKKTIISEELPFGFLAHEGFRVHDKHGCRT
jgi:hypothetical protein